MSRISLFATALLTAAALPLAAQQIKVPNNGLQFQFSPPGARALGMGATFVALADDATAAVSNPAGLTILTKPEVSGQFRVSEYSAVLPRYLEDSTLEASETVSSLSFLSFVKPWSKASLGVYYFQSTNYKMTQSETDSGFLFGFPVEVSASFQEELKLDNFGASFAYKVHPKVSLGASVFGSAISRDRREGFVLGFEGVGDASWQDSIVGDETKVGFTAGALFNPNGKVSGGITYTYNPEFTLDRTVTSSIFGDTTRERTAALSFQVPQVLSAGIGLRPTEKWVVSAEVKAISYSDLSYDTEDAEGNPERVALDNGTEFHLGTEYTLIAGQTPVSLRAGYFYEPDYDGLEAIDSAQNHITFGLGAVFGGKFQIDAAANFSDRVKEGLVSFVVRF
jgi:long-subunit fatty acid transport protein